MHLLQSGVDIAIIALWLGHESIETTHGYMEADLKLKEKALQKLAPAGQAAPRYKADDPLLAFLKTLDYAEQRTMKPAPHCRSPTSLGIIRNSA